MRSCALYMSTFTKTLNLKKHSGRFLLTKKGFFTLFLPLTTCFPPKNRMLLTHHQHDFENFWRHFSWLYTNANTPYKRQVWPRPRRAKVALLMYIFTFCNFCGSPITWLNPPIIDWIRKIYNIKFKLQIFAQLPSIRFEAVLSARFTNLCQQKKWVPVKKWIKSHPRLE